MTLVDLRLNKPQIDDLKTPGVIVRVVQAYRFALDPAPRQAAALASHCGAVRVAFNWGLAQVIANPAQREAERSYGLAEQELGER